MPFEEIAFDQPVMALEQEAEADGAFEAIWVEAADKVYKLGTSDFDKIDIRAIGWTEGLLI